MPRQSTPEQQARFDALTNILRFGSDVGTGFVDTVGNIAAGMGTSAVAGLGGLGELVRPDMSSWDERKERAANRVRDTQEKLSLAPATEAGERGLENIGGVFEHVGNAVDDMYLNPLAEKGGIGPELATAAVVAGNLIGPKGAKVKVKPKVGVVNLNLRSMPPEEAIAAAQRGEHLRRNPEGGYYGAPRDVTSSAKLGANRARMDRKLETSAREIETQLGPEEVGDWYPSQRRGVESVTEPWQRHRQAQAEGLFSPQSEPNTEFGFAARAHNLLARGEPGEPIGVVRTGRQGREFADSWNEGRAMKQGPKTKVYAEHSDPTIPADDPRRIFGTNDFREAQAHGYTDVTGEPQTAGMGKSQHVVMDAETLLGVERANKKGIGGRTDWTGPMSQEVRWITGKADALQKASPNRYPNTPEGRKAALAEASKTIEDAIPAHEVGATYEYAPGAGTEHAPLSGKQPGYGAEGAWVDDAGKDKIYQAQGLLQKPTTQGVGVYQGEFNPVNIAQPIGDFAPGKSGLGRELHPDMQKSLSFAEHLRGATDVQNQAAWHLPVEQAARKGSTKTHALIEHGAPLGEAQMKALVESLPEGWSASATPRGTMLMNFSGENSAAAAKTIKSLQPQVEALTGGKVSRVGMDSDLIDIFQRNGQPTPQGQGIVTSELLQRGADAPPEVARRMSESDPLRSSIRDKHMRDAGLDVKGEPIRADVQLMRRFLSEADWNKAIEAIRKGSTPAAAVALLGYSLSGMAAEEKRAMEGAR